MTELRDAKFTPANRLGSQRSLIHLGQSEIRGICDVPTCMTASLIKKLLDATEVVTSCNNRYSVHPRYDYDRRGRITRVALHKYAFIQKWTISAGEHLLALLRPRDT